MAQRRSGTDFRVLIAWTLGLILLGAGLAVPLRTAATDAAHGAAIVASAGPSAVVAAPTRARADAAPPPATAPVAPTVTRGTVDTLGVPGLASSPTQRMPNDRGPPSI